MAREDLGRSSWSLSLFLQLLINEDREMGGGEES